MATKRVHVATVAITVAQFIIAACAIWLLWSTKVASAKYAHEPFRYKLTAILHCAAILAAFGGATVCVLLCGRFPRACQLWVTLEIAAIALVAVVRAMLAGSNYRNFFVDTGTLAPNELFGASWPLFNCVSLLSVAALLGPAALLIRFFYAARK